MDVLLDTPGLCDNVAYLCLTLLTEDDDVYVCNGVQDNTSLLHCVDGLYLPCTFKIHHAVLHTVHTDYSNYRAK